MGSSKIIFVGAVAVIIGMFGFGIKKAERSSSQIAETHAYQVQAKALARMGLGAAIRKQLPTVTGAYVPPPFSKTTTAGKYGYSISPYNATNQTVTVTSYGIVNDQRMDFVTVVVKYNGTPTANTWRGSSNGWQLKSLTRILSTVSD